MEELQNFLSQISLTRNRRDSWRWSLSHKGIFSVKELSNTIDDKCLSLDGLVQETRWNKLVPKKVNVFVWRVLLGRLPVRVELDKRGLDMDSLLCPHCDNGVESIDHAFVFCNMASSVWSKVFNWWKLDVVNAFTAKDILTHVGGPHFSSQNKLTWQATVWITGYMLWHFRNERVFKAKVHSANKIFQEIQLKCYEWISRRAKSGTVLWQSWVFNPLECWRNCCS